MYLSWVQIPALPPISRGPLGESLKLSEPQFPQLWGGGNNTYLTGGPGSLLGQGMKWGRKESKW